MPAMTVPFWHTRPVLPPASLRARPLLRRAAGRPLHMPASFHGVLCTCGLLCAPETSATQIPPAETLPAPQNSIQIPLYPGSLSSPMSPNPLLVCGAFSTPSPPQYTPRSHFARKSSAVNNLKEFLSFKMYILYNHKKCLNCNLTVFVIIMIPSKSPYLEYSENLCDKLTVGRTGPPDFVNV